MLWDNKRFNHRLWLNVITHSKFISSPFICLFSQIIPIISPIFRVPIWRRHCYNSLWNKRMQHMSFSWQAHALLKSTGKSWHLQVKVLGSLLFYLINCWIERVKWGAQSGCKHLTGDSLTYRNTYFYTPEFRLNYAWVCNNTWLTRQTGEGYLLLSL